MPRFARNDGFTLAEVLITLVIIGVIAAMTVPTLINKTNNQEYVSKLKKAYSTLAQATNLIIAEEGTPRADKGGWATSAEAVYNIYKKKLNNIKECSTDSGCFTQGTITQLNGTVETWNRDNDTNSVKLIMSDGTQLYIHNDWVSDSCNLNSSGSYHVCVYIQIDINGVKKPNTIGRDIFMLVLKENGLYPSGCDYNNCTSTDSNGWGCACTILREGAMNY